MTSVSINNLLDKIANNKKYWIPSIIGFYLIGILLGVFLLQGVQL